MVDRLLRDLRANYVAAAEDPQLVDLWRDLSSPELVSRTARDYTRLLSHLKVDALSDTSPSPSTVLRALKSLTEHAVAQCTQARDFYCAAVRFPTFRPVLRHQDFKYWRNKYLFTSPPKHTHYYDLLPLLSSEPPLDWASRDQVRLRLVLALSVFHLARACDLERLRRDFRDFQSSEAILAQWRRKGEAYYGNVVFLPQKNTAWSVPHLLRAYVRLTKELSVDSDGNPLPHVFVSHNRKRLGCVVANTISGWRTKWLAARNVDTSMYTSHSFRGASLVMLARHNVPPTVLRELGGWSSVDSFSRYYHKVEVDCNPASQLPFVSLVDQPLPEDQWLTKFSFTLSTNDTPAAPVHDGNRPAVTAVSQQLSRADPTVTSGAGYAVDAASGSSLNERSECSRVYRGSSSRGIPGDQVEGGEARDPTHPPQQRSPASDVVPSSEDVHPGKPDVSKVVAPSVSDLVSAVPAMSRMTRPVVLGEGKGESMGGSDPARTTSSFPSSVPVPPPVPQQKKRSRESDQDRHLRPQAPTHPSHATLSARRIGTVPAPKVRRSDPTQQQ